MERSNHIQDVRDLIAKDELVKAINLLRALIMRDLPDSANEVTMLSMEVYTLKKAIIADRVVWEAERIAKNKIAFKILELISLLEARASTDNILSGEGPLSIKKNFRRA